MSIVSNREGTHAEVPDVHPPHAHTWIGKWVFSQDAKYIAIQYSGTAIAIGAGVGTGVALGVKDTHEPPKLIDD